MGGGGAAGLGIVQRVPVPKSSEYPAFRRGHWARGFSDLTDPIPLQKAFSRHLHLRANRGGRLWLARYRGEHRLVIACS